MAARRAWHGAFYHTSRRHTSITWTLGRFQTEADAGLTLIKRRHHNNLSLNRWAGATKCLSVLISSTQHNKTTAPDSSSERCSFLCWWVWLVQIPHQLPLFSATLLLLLITQQTGRTSLTTVLPSYSERKRKPWGCCSKVKEYMN